MPADRYRYPRAAGGPGDVKGEGKTWACPSCTHGEFCAYKTRPAARECKLCFPRFRLRPGTSLEYRKLPVLTWLRAIYFVTQDERGVSAVQLRRFLSLGSYRTAWRMLHKIRRALGERDANYKLSGLVEWDGASFTRVATEQEVGEAKVLIEVESKTWVDTWKRGQATFPPSDSRTAAEK